MKKINDFKNNMLKTEHVRKTFKFKYFWDNAENIENNTNTSTTYFLGVFAVFCLFVDFILKIL